MSEQPASHLARPLASRVAALPAAETREITTPAPERGHEVIVAAQNALAEGKTHYTDRPGILPLRKLIVERLQAYGLSLSPDALTITCGVTEARFVALKQWLGGSKTLYTPFPAQVSGILNLLDTHFTMTPETASVIYVQNPTALQSAVESLIADTTPWLLWELTSETSHEEAAQAAALLERKQLLGRLLVIGELPGLAGWRVGFMAGSDAANKLRAFKQSMTICTPSVSQWAALGTV